MEMEQPVSREERWTLAGILCVACLSRLWGLGTSGFWVDEAIQATTAMRPTFTLSLQLVPSNKPPLFYIIEFLVARVSQTEWAFRLPSMLAGTITVWAMWRLARAAFGNPRTALLSAAFLAVSPLHILLSQEARPYALALLFSLLGVCALFEQINSPWPRGILWVGLWHALAGWTLYFGLGLVILEILWGIGILAAGLVFRGFLWSSRLRKAGGLFLVGIELAVLLMTPLLMFAPGPESQHGGFNFHFPGWSWGLIAQILSWNSYGADPLVLWPLWCAFLAMALTGIAVTIRGRPGAAAFLLLWLFVVQGAQLYLYARKDHWISPRYHILYAPPMLLFAAAGARAILQRARATPRFFTAGLAAALAILLVCAAGYRARQAEFKSDMGQVARQLAKGVRPGDIVITSDWLVAYLYTYYRNHFFPTAPPALDTDRFAAVLGQMRNVRRAWLLGTSAYGIEDCEHLYVLKPGLPRPLPVKPLLVAVEITPEQGIAALSHLSNLDAQARDFLRKPPFEFEIGDPLLCRYVGIGWSQAQMRGDRKVRWVDGRKAELLFQYERQDAPTTLTLEVMPFAWKGFPQQAMRVYWDNSLIHDAPLPGKGFRPLSIPIPPGAHSPGPLHWVRLEFEHSIKSSGLNVPNKTRDLSSAVCRVGYE